MNKELTKLDKTIDKLLDEESDIQYDIIHLLAMLIECSFDSDTLKTKIVSLTKSFHHIQHEIIDTFDQIDFIKKCEKEGYKK